ncbi:hypothetical protein KFE25_008580 [Diacronema lutheri]|uniref:SET domain-containing protein n=1 Tax=Diacronema lutheri TaxID=2081491 RepID=A0A8J5XTC9_DIALT|nr:hypothetical protein KFE25_008580 [Diacronema lutheri]
MAPLRTDVCPVRTAQHGRGLVAAKALPPETVVILADAPIAAVQALCPRPQLSHAPRACAACLRFVGDAASQLRDLVAGTNDAALEHCSPECRLRVECSGSLALTQVTLSSPAVVRIGPELVRLALALVSSHGRDALSRAPLAEFHRAPFESRGAHTTNAADARDIAECWRALSRVRGSGAAALPSVSDFSLLLGLVATNAIEVKVPHPLVFELSELSKSHVPADRRRLAKWAPLLEQLVDARGADQDKFADALSGDGGSGDGSSGEESSGDGSSSEESDDGDEAVQLVIPRAALGKRDLVFASTAFPPSRGIALYPTVAQLNHSCEPNCQVVWAHTPAAEATVIATRRVKAGEELCISYVDTRLGVDERRAALARRYGFVCTCARCTAEWSAHSRKKGSAKRKDAHEQRQAKRVPRGAARKRIRHIESLCA